MIAPCICLGIEIASAVGGLSQHSPQHDIVVRGERTPRSLTDTASSVVVLSGKDLGALPAYDRVEDLFAGIPNVQIGSQTTGPTIRGQDTTGALRDLSAFLGGNRPRTTLVVDGRAVGFNEFVFGSQSLWDVKQVEVYRTPQSTTQGRNSIAGAIFVHTADPTDNLEARGRVIAGDLSTRHLSAMLNSPLVEGLSLRLAADWRNSRPGSHLTDPGRPDFNLNRDRTRLLRLKLRADPPAVPELGLMLTATHARSAMPQIEGLRPPFEQRRDPSATYGYFQTRTDSLTLKADFALAKDLSIDALGSLGQARVKRLAPPGFGLVNNRVRDVSGELVLRRRTGNFFGFTAGLALSEQRLKQDIDLTLVLGRGAFSDWQDSRGIFGEAEFRLAPSLTATTGLRYQWDRQKRLGTLGGVRGRETLDYAGKSDFLLPRLTLAYNWSPRLSTGLTILRASNPGGTTISINGPLAFSPETLWNTEFFARAKLDNGRLRLNSNVFFTRFRDAQRSVNRPFRPPFGRTVTFADVVNVPRARSSGLEVALDWALHPTFELQLSGGMLHTRLEPDPGQPFGKKFQRAPGLSAKAGFDWHPAGGIRVSAQARGRDGYFSDDLNAPELRTSGGWIFDAKASWERGSYRLFGYVRNLTDKLQLTSFSNRELATAEDPRQVGIGLEADF